MCGLGGGGRGSKLRQGRSKHKTGGQTGEGLENPKISAQSYPIDINWLRQELKELQYRF